MFVSVHNLKTNMGVDESIARFFVDRKVPADNAFWRKRFLYIGRGNGYISIPVYYDLLMKLGLPREELLEESHVQFMEKLMHFAILVEYKEMDFRQHLEEISNLLLPRLKNRAFYEELLAYLRQPVLHPKGRLGMPVPSLNRADVFLFILCDLRMTDEQVDKAIGYWYALHTSYLLMDDIYDYKLDKQDQEENAVIDLGDSEIGFGKAFGLLRRNIETMKQINPQLADHFEESMAGLADIDPKL